MVKSTTSKDRLIKFILDKHKLIYERTGIKYVDDLDISNIKKDWDEIDCKKIINSLNVSDDDSCCPWCIRYDNQCYRCDYASNHGECFTDGDTYSQISVKLDGAVLDTFYNEVIEIILEAQDGN